MPRNAWRVPPAPAGNSIVLAGSEVFIIEDISLTDSAPGLTPTLPRAGEGVESLFSPEVKDEMRNSGRMRRARRTALACKPKRDLSRPLAACLNKSLVHFTTRAFEVSFLKNLRPCRQQWHLGHHNQRHYRAATRLTPARAVENTR